MGCPTIAFALALPLMASSPPYQGYIGETANGPLYIYDWSVPSSVTSVKTPFATLSVPRRSAYGLALSPDSATLYVGDSDSNQIMVFNAGTLAFADAILGRKSPAVEMRAKQGHMSYCYQGHIEKIPLLEEILRDSGLAPEQVAYIGDDLTDVVIFRRVGWAVAVGNAPNEVKQAAHYVTRAVGGAGALRETAEVILKVQGFWDEILEKYEIGGVDG